MIHLKRVYEPPSTDDGFRILVERLWPRGLSKSRAQVDLWLKDIAPSPSCELGTGMNWQSGRNSSGGIGQNSKTIPRSGSYNSCNKTSRSSHSCTPRTTQNITVLWC
jgi:hypothetical protein